MPRIILRLKQVLNRLACGKTKFKEHYRYHTPDDPHVPGTDIPRVKPIPLGPRNIGFLDSEIDGLVDALADLRDAQPAVEVAVQRSERKPRGRPRKPTAVGTEVSPESHE